MLLKKSNLIHTKTIIVVESPHFLCCYLSTWLAFICCVHAKAALTTTDPSTISTRDNVLCSKWSEVTDDHLDHSRPPIQVSDTIEINSLGGDGSEDVVASVRSGVLANLNHRAVQSKVFSPIVPANALWDVLLRQIRRLLEDIFRVR